MESELSRQRLNSDHALLAHLLVLWKLQSSFLTRLLLVETIDYLLLISRARRLYWRNIARGLSRRLGSIQSSAVLFHPLKLYRTRKSLFSLSFKSFELFESNVLSHYSRFTSLALTSLIMPMGITGKFSPKYWPITVRVIFRSSTHIIIFLG